MSMGKKSRSSGQEPLWVSAGDLPRSAGHPFNERLNGILDSGGFDEFAESECARFYAERMGRPSLAPGRYFRLLLLGYFEGLDSERAIAWRAQDSLSIRRFLGLGLSEAAPDHSTISRTRRRIDVESHRRVFSWVLGRLAESGLLSGKTVGVDATTLEANAALRSIVRRDSGDDYETFVRGLAEASGVETPTRAELARFDRKRKKKLSNEEWENPHDPDAQITKMKDGRTHLAYKAEQAVDLEHGTIVGVSVQGGAKGDTESLHETLEEAFEQVSSVTADEAAIEEVVADKGYHSNDVLADIDELGLRRLHRGTGPRSPSLEGQEGPAGHRVREPPPDPRQSRQADAAPARRTDRAAPRSPVRDRRHAPRASARSLEHPQASALSRQRVQPRALDAPDRRLRHSSKPPKQAPDPARPTSPLPAASEHSQNPPDGATAP